MPTEDCTNPPVLPSPYGSMFVTVYAHNAWIDTGFEEDDLEFNENAEEVRPRHLFPWTTGLVLPKGTYWLYFQLYNEGGQFVEDFWDKIHVKCETDRIFTIEIDFSKQGDDRYTFKDALAYIEEEYDTPEAKIAAVLNERFFQQFRPNRDAVRLSHDGTEEYTLLRRSLPTRLPLSPDGTHRPNANSLMDRGKYGNVMLKWPKFYYKFTSRETEPVDTGPHCPLWPAPWYYDADTELCYPPDPPETDPDAFLMAAGKNHVCVVINGELWSAGDNSFGQLGRQHPPLSPEPLQPNQGESVAAFALRREAWILARNERLEQIRFNFFNKVVHPGFPYDSWEVVGVSCGEAHTAIIVENRETKNRDVYLCGRNNWGELLVEANPGPNFLTRFIPPDRAYARCIKVECGEHHTHLIYETGSEEGIEENRIPTRTTELFNGGRNEFGELCRGFVGSGIPAWVQLPERELSEIENLVVDLILPASSEDPDAEVIFDIRIRGKISNIDQTGANGELIISRSFAGEPRFWMESDAPVILVQNGTLNSSFIFENENGEPDGSFEVFIRNQSSHNLPVLHYTFVNARPSTFYNTFYYLDIEIKLNAVGVPVVEYSGKPANRQTCPYDISNKFYHTVLITSRYEDRSENTRTCGNERCPSGFYCRKSQQYNVCTCGDMPEIRHWREKLPGQVWTTGTNHYGQLGRITENFYNTSLIELTEHRDRFRTVRTGWGNTAFIAIDNALWTAGANYFCQLGVLKPSGNINRLNLSVNRHPTTDVIVRVRDVQLGQWHILYTDMTGVIWSAGIGENNLWNEPHHGVLLRGNTNSGNIRDNITAISPGFDTHNLGNTGFSAHTICAGYMFSGFLSDGLYEIWTAGQNRHGQRGRDNIILEDGTIDRNPFSVVIFAEDAFSIDWCNNRWLVLPLTSTVASAGFHVLINPVGTIGNVGSGFNTIWSVVISLYDRHFNEVFNIIMDTEPGEHHAGSIVEDTRMIFSAPDDLVFTGNRGGVLSDLEMTYAPITGEWTISAKSSREEDDMEDLDITALGNISDSYSHLIPGNIHCYMDEVPLDDILEWPTQPAPPTFGRWYRELPTVRISLAYQIPEDEENDIDEEGNPVWKTFHILEGREVATLYTSLFPGHITNVRSRATAFSLYVPNDPLVPDVDGRFSISLPRHIQDAVKNANKRYQPFSWDILTMMRIIQIFRSRGRTQDISEHFDLGTSVMPISIHNHINTLKKPFSPIFLDGIRTVKHLDRIRPDGTPVVVRNFDIYTPNNYAILPLESPLDLRRNDFQTYREVAEIEQATAMRWMVEPWNDNIRKLLPKSWRNTRENAAFGSSIFGIDMTPATRTVRDPITGQSIPELATQEDTGIFKLFFRGRDHNINAYELHQMHPDTELLPFYFVAFGATDGQDILVDTRYDIEPTYVTIEKDK